MRKILFIVLAAVLVINTSAFAKLYAPRRAKANQANASTQAAKQAVKTDTAVPVRNAVDKAYDANGNGKLEPAEAKLLLKNRFSHIMNKSSVPVESAIDEKYDTNKNGMLEAGEIKAMGRDAV